VGGEPAATAETLEQRILEVGRHLAERFPGPSRNPVRALDERAMRATTRARELRAALFRLVDVSPACRSLDDLARHLTSFAAEVEHRPGPLDAAMRAANTKPGRMALGAAVAAGVRHMAQRFIAGESPQAATGELERLWRSGIASSVDLLGEATVTSAEADRYAARCTEALEVLAAATAGHDSHPVLDADHAGALPRANLSVKVTALTPLIRPENPRRGIDDAAGRLRPLLRTARELGAHLHIDMESVDTRETTQELLFELLAEPEFGHGPSIGVVLQAYLRDSPAELDELLTRAQADSRAQPLTIRLVKGAYWDHEIVEAAQHGWSPPVFEEKADSDRNFELLSRRLLDRVASDPASIRVAIGSHNLRSVSHAIAYAELVAGRVGADGGSPPPLEVQVLRGLGDDLARALADAGVRTRVYCPVGDLVAGMAYLVRRLLENTANTSFLADQAQGTPLEELLAAP
jgi:RHH-type proline utilization regulon transcriptional repressor/proline dehydrogenase/delta 1-pyrroline-5-carboxylate dehydrogenase